MSLNQKICPECGAVFGEGVNSCRLCGYKFSAGSGSRGRVSDSMAPVNESLGRLLKIVMICGVIALIGWGGYSGVAKFMKSLEPKNPFPTDPAETSKLFFTALAEEDYQSCYKMLEMSRKAATVIKKNSRDSYSIHFDRIRIYLLERAGEDFIESMQISEDGREVLFKNGIALTMQFTTSHDSDKVTHYAIDQVKEFPIDKAPGIGLEKHNRQISRFTEGLGSEDDADDVSEIIRRRDYESKTERRGRMIETFQAARQLDTRHTVLEYIIREFHQDKATQGFLAKLAKDETQPPQLRKLAQAYLE